ncbi:MAG: transcriptional repressor [Clostridiales bacterium]|nr:transcriptional repressor [Clostridiales bacterium]
MRNTLQYNIVFDTVSSMHTHPSADDIYEAVIKKWPSVSKGTVYRNLNQLASEGKILRIAVANAPDRFDHTTHPHVHIMCDKCGKVFDVMPDNDFSLSYKNNESFVITGYDIMFHGYCSSCKASEEVTQIG